jgi:hypothetical protein
LFDYISHQHFNGVVSQITSHNRPKPELGLIEIVEVEVVFWFGTNIYLALDLTLASFNGDIVLDVFSRNGNDGGVFAEYGRQTAP